MDGDYALLDKFKQITVFANPSTELVPLYGRSIRIRDKLFLAYSNLLIHDHAAERLWISSGL